MTNILVINSHKPIISSVCYTHGMVATVANVPRLIAAINKVYVVKIRQKRLLQLVKWKILEYYYTFTYLILMFSFCHVVLLGAITTMRHLKTGKRGERRNSQCVCKLKKTLVI